MPDDPFDDPLGPPPPPHERRWRHPSELGPSSGPPVTFVTRSVRRAPARTWLVGLLCTMLGSLLTLGVVIAVGGFRPPEPGETAIEKQYVDLDSNPQTPIDIAEKVLPAVVRIDVIGSAGPATGTAVVFSSSGYLITTADLVDGALSINAVFNDGSSTPARFVAADIESDIAVLKVERSGLQVAVLGRPSEKLQLGEPVLAIDSTLGGADAPRIPPIGQINALGKRIQSEDPNKTLYGMIQTNLSLTSEATGAPLVDSKGAVIGVMTSRGYDARADSSGQSSSLQKGAASGTAAAGRSEAVFRFATPIDFARSVADALIRDGRYSKASLGVGGEDLTPEEAKRWEVSGGLKVTSVRPNSPAAVEGLQVGDIIVALEDDPITSWDSLVIALRKHRPGEAVAVWYLRSGETVRQPKLPRLEERTSTR